MWAHPHEQMQRNRGMIWDLAVRIRRIEKTHGLSLRVEDDLWYKIADELKEEAPYKYDAPQGHEPAIPDLESNIVQIGGIASQGHHSTTTWMSRFRLLLRHFTAYPKRRR